MSNPTVFINYSQDNESHKTWVRHLATELQKKGVIVALDQWEMHPGIDLPHYMETNVRNCQYVLLICTPPFAVKANSGKGGVGYEKIVVTGEIFGGIANPGKFVPLLRSGSPDESLPSYLRSKLFIDFRDDQKFEKSLEELLRHLFQTPKYIPPPIGSKPAFEQMTDEPIKNDEEVIFCRRCGVIVGSPTECLHSFSFHDFVKGNSSSFCSRCGVKVGNRTECIESYISHNFIHKIGTIYCRRCGATPGIRSKCIPFYNSHDFIKD